MKRIASFGGTLALTLILVGAGCSNTPSSPSTDTSDNTTSEQTNETIGKKQTGSDNIQLIATAVGARQVKFEWELSGDLAEPTRFILLRSEDPNPSHDGKTFWFRQQGNRSSATWVNLPAGEQHFRICTSSDGDACAFYSDDISVDVLSGPAPVKKMEISDTAEVTNETEEIQSEEPTPLETEYAISDTTSTEEIILIEEVSTTTPEGEVPTTDTTSTENMSTSAEEAMTETTTTTDSSTSTTL
ncbi:MAG: hypothetical protein CO030_04390 [Candidatus Magasanikbacteria bacterium CG_4_9_14_0_2_um_filter_42_11]|uniref:Fibronectin type-III domain-containing protein n=1 Tax=Candidatus Magasanikbacteria bacterium CG_4_9_14_0_2_um_filter_42_11 TaxID=1974643 RepID=A0A2M8F8S5_9BACT|nr:MAG: hypothetical protein COU34_02010 [Candidatus Magasanikbacteria bacterium CG10_big_fil_rev_8_21_14_0_10_43_9]PIY92713.1 MAG: hypothetical protein COY70_01830 [Candidatus Magasanikbacteria bacterium CG_4_10_14_0_8_um_filter_42_12]PJC52145.1 MAG: hypothetical protein CO030_04390 [Candidatus Magasanikbacteria bacterium CG_4_9_14_0_2_um_filter_42_11]